MYSEGTNALTYAREMIEPYLHATSEQLDLIVLWSAYTHAYDQFATAPRLSARSQGPGEGKSTLLDIVKVLSSKGEKAGYSTGPSIYSLIDAEHPTLLLDEIDNLFSATGFSRANPSLQAVLNDGYTREGFVRVMRSGMSVKLSIFGPVAFGGIGRLPAPMADRAIPIMMRKGVPDEVFDPAIEGVFLADCRNVFESWLSNKRSREFLQAFNRRPDVPGLDGARQRQIIAPLMAVGALAGDEWAHRAVAAARYAFLGVSEESQLTRFQLALRDALRVWDKDVSFMRGSDLAALMAGTKESIWKSLSGPSATAERQLGALLRGVGVSSSVHRIDNVPTRSYARVDLEKAMS